MDFVRFTELVSLWKKDCTDLSLSEIEIHPSYLELKRVGGGILPWVLQDLAKDSFIGWLPLLEDLTGENPARGQETITGATRRWIAWGKRQGLV